MSRVLLDENVPVGLRAVLTGHAVFTVEYQGWKGLANGRLLAAAKVAHFDALITADQNLRFQQDIVGSRLALIVLSSTNWTDIKAATQAIRLAVDRAVEGTVTVVPISGASERGAT